MKFLHQPFRAKSRQIIHISFDKPTWVRLIHEEEFERYKLGKTFRYRGGYFQDSPVEFEVPFDGVWHAVVEKGTHFHPLNVTATARLEQPKLETLNGTIQMETHQKLAEYDDTLE